MTFGTIYSYPQNPRVFKSLIAAAYAGVDVKVAEAKFPLSDEFKAKFPLGKVPAFESADGLKLYESNAIAYYVASQATKVALLGKDKKDQALVQQFIAVSDNEFSPVSAVWLYPIQGYMPPQPAPVLEKAKNDCKRALLGLNNHLSTRTFLVGERVTLADIVLACSLLNFYKLVFDKDYMKDCSHVSRWFLTCINQKEFKGVIGEFKICEKMSVAKAPEAKKEEAKEAPKPKESPAPAATDAPEQKAKNPLDLLPKSTFILDEWKRCYSNNDTRPVAVDYFWKNFDPQGYSIYRVEYKYNNELTQVFMSSNLVGGFYQRLERARKYAFGSMLVLGENNNNEIYGYFVIRGQEVPFEFTDTADYESYKFTKVDITKKDVKDDIERVWAWEDTKGKKVADGKVFK